MGFEHPLLRSRNLSPVLRRQEKNSAVFEKINRNLYGSIEREAYIYNEVYVATKKASARKRPTRAVPVEKLANKASPSVRSMAAGRLLLSILEVFIYFFGTLAFASVIGAVTYYRSDRFDLMILMIFLFIFSYFLASAARKIKKSHFSSIDRSVLTQLQT